jgi:hypothetical protein
MKKEVTMYKLAALGVLIAALAAPASAVGQRAHQLRVQPPCPQNAVFQPGRNYAMCDGRFWIREPQSGKVVRVPFWRLQRPSDPNRPDDDRP